MDGNGWEGYEDGERSRRWKVGGMVGWVKCMRMAMVAAARMVGR